MNIDQIINPPLYALTTVDNPFHPVDERDDWERYDRDHGYNTDGILYSISGISNYEEEAEKRRAENSAIDTLLRLEYNDGVLFHKKVLIEDGLY